MNNRRRSAFDLGGRYNAAIVAIVKSGFGKWKPAKIQRHNNYFLDLFRHPIFKSRPWYDFGWWGICFRIEYVEWSVKNANKFKRESMLNKKYNSELRRLRKPWEAIKTK